MQFFNSERRLFHFFMYICTRITFINTPQMKKSFILIIVAMLTLASCSTERRGLNQMRKLTYEVETKGQYYDVQDWKDAYDDFRAIDDRMDVRKLTNEQAAEYGELKGRLVSKFAKCSVQSVVNSVKNYINQGAGIIKGIVDGLLK